MSENKNLWIFIETDKEGAAINVGLELCGPGREIADQIGEKMYAVIIGENVDKAAEQVKEYGVDGIIKVEGPVYKEYNTEVYTNAICKLVEKHNPNIVFVGATNLGRDLGPRVAARLNTGLTADCTELSIDVETKNMQWTRPAFGGNLMAMILCPDHKPQMGTVRPGVFKKNPTGAKADIEVIEENIEFAQEDIRTKVIEFIPECEGDTVDLLSAEYIVSGGRGLQNPDNFALIEGLAKALDATVGSSRAAVDSGWISHSHQVGQSGKTVGPKIYVAVGISGAIQHLAGMSSSDIVIAINKDPDAPIFTVADYGIVGDLFEVVPKLTEAINKIKNA